MIKNILIIASLATSLISYSQVGINTVQTQADLHVNGDLQITRELYVGGDASTKGSPGGVNDVLTSQGVGKAPKWQSLEGMNVPTVAYYTANTYQGNTGPTELPNQYLYVNLPLGSNYDPDIVESVKEKVIKVKKAGYYVLTFNVSISVIDTPTDGTAILTIWETTTTNGVRDSKSNLVKNSAYAVAPDPISINTTGIVYLEADTELIFTVAHTRTFRLKQYATTVTFLSAKK